MSLYMTANLATENRSKQHAILTKLTLCVFCGKCYEPVSSSHCEASHGSNVYKKWIKNDLQRSGGGLIDILSRQFLEGLRKILDTTPECYRYANLPDESPIIIIIIISSSSSSSSSIHRTPWPIGYHPFFVLGRLGGSGFNC
jgi:hypothetical protein